MRTAVCSRRTRSRWPRTCPGCRKAQCFFLWKSKWTNGISCTKRSGYWICGGAGRQPEGQLKRWITGILRQEGRQISPGALELFLSSVGDDMEHIRTELDKLIAYTEGREEIRSSDVEAICSVQVTGQIFEMIADIAARRQKKALEKYYDLLALKEPPMRILFLIARQFNQLLVVKELAGSGNGKNEIARKAGIQPFVAGKVMAQAKNFRKEELRACVEKCVGAEEAVKTGRLADNLAVELLITEFSSERS